MRNKRYCRFLFIAAIALFILGAKSIEASADNYDLWVGGVQVTDANAGSITGNNITGGVPTYNPTNKTLNLNGATINGGYEIQGMSTKYYNIYSNGISGLTIEGSGTLTGADYGIYTVGCEGLTVNGTGNGIEISSQSFGIDANPSIYISSSDSWTHNGNLTLNGKINSTGSTGCGIYAYHNITIENGATITANGGFAGIATYLPYRYAASDSSYRRQDIGELTINGGTITAQGTYDGILSAYNLTINGGTITATSTASNPGFAGIRSEYGDFCINNGITKVESTGATVAIESGRSKLTVADGIRLTTPSNGTKNLARFYNSDNTDAAHVILEPLAGATIKFGLCGAVIYHDGNAMNQWGRTYTGSELVPPVEVYDNNQTLTEGVDYTLSYTDANGNTISSPTDAGTYYTVVTGKGNYAGSGKRAFIIGARYMQYTTSKEVIMPADSFTYTGNYIRPVPTLVKVDGITLVKDIDYSITYLSNKNIGTATYRIKAIRNFDGRIAEGNFEIVAADNNDNDDNNASNNSSSNNNASGNASSNDGNSDNNDSNVNNNSSQNSSTDNNAEGNTNNNSQTGDTSSQNGSDDTSDSTSDSAEQEEKSAISLNTNSVVLQKGKTIKTVKVSLTNDEIASVKSANTKIATVSHKGNTLSIKGIKKGKTKITVKTDSGLTAKLSVEVQQGKVVTEKLKLSKSKITLKKKGKKATVTVTATPDYASTKEKITVSSSDKKIAAAKYDSITGKVTITAKKKGSCVITVKAGKKAATIKVKVKK